MCCKPSKMAKDVRPSSSSMTRCKRRSTALLQPVEDKRTDIQAVNTALSAIDQLVPAQAAEVKRILNTAVAATSTAAIDKVMAAVKAQAADKAAAIERSCRRRSKSDRARAGP